MAVVFGLFVFLDSRIRILPDSIHDHLPTHRPGFAVTDVTVLTCSSVNFLASCKRDSEYWVRIEKDLYLHTGWMSSAYVHVERKKEEELLPTDKVVVDLKISRLQPQADDDDQKAGESDPWEKRPGGIWLKRSSKRRASDSQKTITSVDVLFGADAVDPRPNWEVKDTHLLLNSRSEAMEARLSIRRDVSTKPKRPTPRINENSRFKIMQLSDLHLSTGVGICRDPYPLMTGQNCEADPRTLEFVGRLLDEEKPDLVVLAGDQINGETSKDAATPLFKAVKPMVDRQIPYAAIFGNHDDEGNLKRADQMSILEQLPYSMSLAGPEEIDGVGNYYIEVLGRGTSSNSALTLYFFDTHSYSPDERQYQGYDWIKPNQIRWFKDTAQRLKRRHNDYTHIHMNMAFIHIPLPEYLEKDNYYKGGWRETPTAPAFNSHLKDAFEEEGVLFTSCGQ